MVSKAHALARDALVRTLTAYSGITTDDGAVGGGTLIDTNLIDNPSISPGAIAEKTLLIMSGDAIGQDKGAASFNNGTGAVTLQGTGFDARIMAGTIYRILNISSIEIDVANIQEDVGDMADPAATGAPTDIEPLMSYAKQAINELLGPSGGWSNLNNEAINSLDLAIQYIAAVMGFNGSNVFNPVVGGVPRTNMDAVFGALDVVLQVIDANVDWVKEAAGNDNWGFGALRNHILVNMGLIETVDAIVDAIFGAIADGNFGLGALRNHILANKGLIETVDAVVDAIFTAIGDNSFGLGALRNHILVNKALIEAVDTVVDAIKVTTDRIEGATGVFHEQAAAAVNVSVDNSENDIFDLSTASTRYIVRNLRLKSVDPTAGETITIRLYELINGSSTLTDSFVIDHDNYMTYFSLMDMFGVPQLAGDDIHVVAIGSVAGPIAVTGEYSHAKTSN